MSIAPFLRQLHNQYADEIATGRDQSRLGCVVTRLMFDLHAKIDQEDLSKLRADDANFLERYMQNPQYAKLVARYPWAPLAAEANKLITVKVQKETSTMSTQDNSSLITSIYDNIGVANGSIVFSDGPLDFDHVRNCLREARFGSGLVAIPNAAWAAVKEICSSVYYKRPMEHPRLSLHEVTHVGIRPSAEVFSGGQLYRIDIAPEDIGNGMTASVYFIVNVTRTPRPASAPAGGFKRGELPVVAARTPAAKTHANGAPLGAQIPRKVRDEVSKREWPAFQEPEPDSGRPRRKGQGKKKNSGGGNRTERRYQ